MQHFIKVTFFEHFTLFITLVYFFSICNIQYTTKLMFTVVLWLKIKIEIIGIVKSATCCIVGVEQLQFLSNNSIVYVMLPNTIMLRKQAK